VGRTAESLAEDLFRSLHDQLLTLPDDTLVLPAHGAGSACGKHLSTAASSTIGEQRATNYALAPMSEGQFVEAVTEGQGVAPLYFAFAADANRRERELLDDHEPPPALAVDEALELAADGAVLLDTRAPEAFASGHLRGSINVGLDGRFAEYAGDVIRPGQQVVVVGDPERGTEAKVRLARIGFDGVAGEVTDVETVLADRPDLAATAPRVPAADLAAWVEEEPELQVVDVRGPGEIGGGGQIPGARSIPLPQLLDHLDDLDPTRPTVVYCAGGYRSSVAASTLRAHGFAPVADLIGGYGAWESTVGSVA
jgi:rhodanese-related sulfurtransferase